MEVLPSGYLKSGLYRNHNGSEIIVRGYWHGVNGLETLGRIHKAVTRNWPFGSSTYLVTAESMRDAGYELVEEKGDGNG